MKCQQNKVQHKKKTEELYLLEIPKKPWQEIIINIGPLSQSNRNYYGYNGLIYKDNLAQGDNNNGVITENHQNLSR